MKQFNLEEYLKHPTRKVVTGDGRNARIVCTDVKDDDYPILVLVEQPENSDHEDVYSYTKDGHYFTSDFLLSENNLFFAPEKHEGWVNIYKSQGRLALFTCGLRYDSEEEARREAIRNRDKTAIATVKIEWEE